MVFVNKNKKQIKGLTPQTMDRLVKYQWPGNVRELMNSIERAVVSSRSEYIDEEELTLLNVNESFREGAVPTGHEAPGNLSPDEVEKT